MQRIGLIHILIFLCLSLSVSAEDKTPRAIPLDEFIKIAAKNDTEFEEILINELKLNYTKDLVLPARDIVLAVKHQYDFILNQDRNQLENAVGLSKLFPYTGTEVAAEYSYSPSFSNETMNSEFSVNLSQSIGRNAFGKATRLLDTIVGLENDVARYQIIEAYEDYLSSIIIEYINWYSALKSLEIAKSTYNENVKLLDNIKERQKNKIALDVDVNKITLQVYDKQENLISYMETYENQLTKIRTILRYENDEVIVPADPDFFFSHEKTFEEDFKEFKETSRTEKILNLLEKKSSFEVTKNADDLLPSINLLVGYDMEGKRESLYESDNMFFMGLSMEWPFYPNQVERAEYETSKISLEETRLSNTNVYFRLQREIKNLHINLKRQRLMLDISEKKKVVSKAVVKDETENYMYGKITLNDFIQAVNAHDNARLSIVIRQAQIDRLMVERLRILDLLVTRKQINERHSINIEEIEQ